MSTGAKPLKARVAAFSAFHQALDRMFAWGHQRSLASVSCPHTNNIMYIHRERERERWRCEMYIYVYTCIETHHGYGVSVVAFRGAVPGLLKRLCNRIVSFQLLFAALLSLLSGRPSQLGTFRVCKAPVRRCNNVIHIANLPRGRSDTEISAPPLFRALPKPRALK